ncbi:MAG: HAD-IG family 5'-nucleotidase [Desulfobacteraceae bacterium]|nr:HAD-IG family 5'-nucleotidase [Desulfobacteraceae bacterium]
MDFLNRSHGIFCNRTLNLNAIRAIGYDMDYTLVHYRMQAWEERAYAYIRERLALRWPVNHLVFDPDLVMRGLVIDTQLGNVVKANRFGYIKRAFHGTTPLDFEAFHRLYQRTLVDLSEDRWYFLNTLFSISEACIFMQLVEMVDRGELAGCMSYEELMEHVRRSVDETHMEGRLKAEILADPGQFVVPDENTPLALLDQKRAGKRILLITNSEWSYAAPILAHAFDPYLPKSCRWRDLFDIVIVRARKPDFFTYPMPAFDVVEDGDLLREHHGPMRSGHIYVGGNAQLLEASLGLKGEEIMYVGDHIFTDVNISKKISRWRTALIIRELEDEILAVENCKEEHAELERLMAQKERLESEHCSLRLAMQRIQKRYGPRDGNKPKELQKKISDLHAHLAELDARIGPLAQGAAVLLNPHWGLLMRTGMDKSHLARQIESYADIYTARVSNFLPVTPFAFLRSSRGSLPHDPGCA